MAQGCGAPDQRSRMPDLRMRLQDVPGSSCQECTWRSNTHTDCLPLALLLGSKPGRQCGPLKRTCMKHKQALHSRLCALQVTDLHRHFVDELTIPDAAGTGVLRRVDEVFDCWFESGSMPYGQVHYPFEQKQAFEAQFPADFVAEGVQMFPRPDCRTKSRAWSAACMLQA